MLVKLTFKDNYFRKKMTVMKLIPVQRVTLFSDRFSLLLLENFRNLKSVFPKADWNVA